MPFPSTTKRRPESQNWSRFYHFVHSSNDWKSGVKFCTAATFIVFATNLSVTIWAATHYKTKDGRQVLYEGDCSAVAKLSTITHVIINTLSTVILSSSNYCMQCLSAPTRQEVDRAHDNGWWLDIGVLSPRNLGGIEKRRLILWCILGMSSMPIHLL